MSTLCNSDYSDCYRWRPVSIELKNGSSVQGSTVSNYEGQRRSGHTATIRSPKKRLRPKTPTPPVTPKPHPTAPKPSCDPDKSSTNFIQPPAALFLNGKHLFPDSEIMSTDFKEVPMGMSDLRLEMGLLLEERNHGALRSGKISNHLVANWINENHEMLENDDIRFEYNYLSQTVQIQTMALPIHESLHIYFGREVILALAEKFGRRQAGNMVTVAGSGTTFSGFTGDGLGTSRKIPDCYIQLRGGRFPTVVCEVGWAESFEDLLQDARLWLLHTNGETKIVIVLAFAEEKPKTEVVSGRLHPEPITPTTANDDGVTLPSTSNCQEISYTTTSNHEASVPQITSDEATTPPTTGDEATTPPTTGNGSEESLIKSIDGGTDPNDLAEQLFALNEQGKLQHPLLAKVHARLHIFKASKEGDDIVESFSANLLPKQPADSAAPKEFGITLHDMLGKLVPAGHDREQEITFPLGDLKEVIEDSIPRTARLRASDRAIKLLKDTVGLDEEPTFAQRKRRRLDPFGLWK